MTYIETSAKNFSNVSESFISCAKMILAKINNKQIDPKNEVSPMIKILFDSWESKLEVWGRKPIKPQIKMGKRYGIQPQEMRIKGQDVANLQKKIINLFCF